MGIPDAPSAEQQRPWRPCDLLLLQIVSQQRVLRLDQVARFLAVCEAQTNEAPEPDLKRAAHHLVARLQQAGLVQQHRWRRGQPAWIWLTKAGMRTIGLSSSGKRPAHEAFALLHAASTIRLLLTEQQQALCWRSLLPRQRAGSEKPGLPPLVAEVCSETGERIAIHVVLRLTGTQAQVSASLRAQMERATRAEVEQETSACWYYATAEAARRLRAARARLAVTWSQEQASAIKIFSYPPLPRQVCYRGHEAPVRTLSWSPDGMRMASADAQALQVWETTSGNRLVQIPLVACPVVTAWSCGGSWMALGDEAGKLLLWEGSTGKTVPLVLQHPARITGLACSPGDDALLACCDASGRLRLYDVQHPALCWDVACPSGAETLAWSPDGTRLAVGGHGPFVSIVRATTGTLLQTYRKHQAAVRALAWSPDSRLLASASANAVSIWEAGTGKKRWTIRSPMQQVEVLSWSPDHSRLAGAGTGPSLSVWQVATGRLLSCEETQAKQITSLAWAPERMVLAWASADGTVCLTPLPGGRR